MSGKHKSSPASFFTHLFHSCAGRILNLPSFTILKSRWPALRILFRRHGCHSHQHHLFALTSLILTTFISTTSANWSPPTSPFATHYWDCCRQAFSYPHDQLSNAHVLLSVDACQRTVFPS